MGNRKLDKWIAKNVMGWKLIHFNRSLLGEKARFFTDPQISDPQNTEESIVIHEDDWYPTENWVQCQEEVIPALRKIVHQGFDLLISTDVKRVWTCDFEWLDSVNCCIFYAGDDALTLELAFCKAAKEFIKEFKRMEKVQGR